MNHREDYHNETYWKRFGCLALVGCGVFTVYCFAVAYQAITGTLNWVGFGYVDLWRHLWN